MLRAAMLATVGIWWVSWASSAVSHDDTAGAEVQLAVLSDGFALSQPSASGYRVTELERDGRDRRALPPRELAELRVVGTSSGTAGGWRIGNRLVLRRLADDADGGTWGKSVRQLCDGVGSNDARFAIGWLEADGAVWIVHGPTVRNAGGPDAAELLASPASTPEQAQHAQPSWCGIASAEQNVAMLWRTGDQLHILMCNKKRCGSLPGKIKLDRRRPILGFGCLRTACLIATRDEAGQPRVTYITDAGRSKWSLPIHPASEVVSIVGYSDGAFAVGYATPGSGPEVVRIDTAGKSSLLWRDEAAHGAPAVAWSAGQLLIAHRHGDRIVNEVIPVAR